MRVSKLMLINRDKLYNLAERQHKVVSTYITKRGNIYDTNGVDLAVSVEMDSIYACPPEVKDPEGTARLLCDFISMDRSKLIEKLKSKKNFVWIKRRVPPSVSEKIGELELAGIGFVNEDKRFYPHKRLGCHYLGFVGIDSQGLSGLEYGMDKYLKSTISHYIAFRDAAGRKLFEVDVSEAPAIKNYNLALTVDVMIQHIAERELTEAVSRSRASGGTIIVMDPESGEILAMANLPSFDPNRFLDFSETSWTNRAVSMNFEPGSTFKIFLASGVIEEGLAISDDVINCEGGSLVVMNTEFHENAGGFNRLPMSDVIAYSSNIGAIKLGMLLGSEKFYEYIKAFGFGDKTGISLPGEEKGIVSLPSSWNDVDLAAASFGQGLSVTPIQLIVALSAIANGGFLVEPHIVKTITDIDGEIIYEAKPKIRKKVLEPETADIISNMMIKVVEEGTGTRADVEGFAVAGKTGTAQIFDKETGKYSETEFIASFIGFIPAEDPKLAILVLIDRPKTDIYGGTVAASIFSETARDVLNYLGIFPDDIYRTKDEIGAKNDNMTISPLM